VECGQAGDLSVVDEGCVMSGVPILSGVFDPEQLAAISRAFEEVCEDLGFTNEDARELVARTVVKLAESGARGSKTLRKMAIQELCPPTEATKRWRIWRIPAKYVGQVDAKDEKDALDKAIRIFNITDPETQKRLIAQRFG
jgi:hypothetical protein